MREIGGQRLPEHEGMIRIDIQLSMDSLALILALRSSTEKSAECQHSCTLSAAWRVESSFPASA